MGSLLFSVLCGAWRELADRRTSCVAMSRAAEYSSPTWRAPDASMPFQLVLGGLRGALARPRQPLASFLDDSSTTCSGEGDLRRGKGPCRRTDTKVS
jgi:hypothetical protein